MIGFNGGLLGSQRTTTTSAGIGVWTANEQVLLRRVNTWPRTDDPYLANVSLLLHMNGSNNSTVFADSGPGAATVTTIGDAKISTTQSKFGGASGAFDGSGDYLSCTLGAIGTNDFTIETYVRMTSFANYRMLYDTRASDGDTAGFVWGVNSSGQLFVYLGSFVLTTGTLTVNTWSHVALTRASGTWRIFVDGALQAGSYSNSGNLTRTAVRIGMDWATLYGVNGFLDEYRKIGRAHV